MVSTTVKPSPLTQWPAAILAWLLLLGPVTWYLVGPSSRVLDRALSVDRVDGLGEPVGLLFSNGPAVSRQLPLWREGSIILSRYDELALRIVTDGTAPVINAAVLTLGECRFVLASPAEASDGGLLVLARAAPCDDHSASTATLDIAMNGPGALKLAGWRVSADGAPDHEGLTITPPGSRSAGLLLLRGRVRQSTDGPDMSRLAVLMWLWDDTTGMVTAGLLGSAAVLWAMGVWLLITWSGDAPGRLWRAAAGAGSLTLALGLMWTLIIPPLQGADGPDHLLSYGEVSGQTDLPPALEALARRVHFERVRFHRDEYVAGLDIAHPHPVAWTGDVHAERMQSRSPVAAILWRAVAPLTRHASLAITLQRLRIFNALVFAVAVAIAAALVTGSSDSGGPWLLAGAMLSPSVPYFAVMLSDWAFLVPWLVLASAAALTLAMSGSRTGVAGLVLGVSGALLLGTSISALPVLAVCAWLLLVHMLAGPHRRDVWPFWGGLAVGVVVLVLVTGDLGQVGFQRYDAPGRATFAQLLAVVNRGLQTVLARPWVLALPLVGLAMLDRALAGLRQRVRDSRTIDRALQRLAFVWVGVACGQMAWSLLGPLPMLGEVGTPGLDTTVGYTKAVMASVLTSARLTGFDHLVFTSLWGGFGWVDTTLPPVLLALLVVVLVLSLVALAVTPHAALRRWGLASLVGGVMGLTLVAVAASLMGRNVHGRYLLPVSLPVTIIALGAAGHWLTASPRRWPRTAAMVALALMHGVALLWVAMRYYGPGL